ncbi:sacsin N-terminal ATP-binding-like domain-containing protein [Sinomonas flava]|uniref:Superfamily II DNA or RNA helicase n=1 Tax=Sinomonas flava TaxID=496857 RepID=A0ABP5NN06_9MICC
MSEEVAPNWTMSVPEIERVVWEQTAACLAVYREDPSRVEQDSNNELRISEGGYADRQLFELVQNAIDAARDGGGRIAVHLTSKTLYVANDGAPFTADGVRAVMASDLSRKDDDRIGRFGIGFKSVLAVTSSPRIFSTSVSFAFDATWAAETLKDAGFTSPNYPVMRLARTMSATVEAQRDPVLSGLMGWASTIVVLPVSRRLQELSNQLMSFPPEFALFSTHIREAALIDGTRTDGQGSPLSMRIRQTTGSDGVVTLHAGNSETRWVVETRKHRPSVRSRVEAGRVARRDSVDIQWAVSKSRRNGNSLLHADGQFWAYFPTKARTTLSGLLNAPWKLSDDRLDLLPGSFNEEILRDEIPVLVAAGVARLHSLSEDIGSDQIDAADVLDVLPARGRETRGWADTVIGREGWDNPVFSHLRVCPSVPDGVGTLRVPTDLFRAPASTSPEWVKPWNEWLKAWAEIPNAPLTAWVHPDAYSNQERRLKLDRLFGRRPRTVAEWLETLVADGSVAASANAIALAAQMTDDLKDAHDPQSRALRDEVSKARIIRLEDGTFSQPESGKLFVRASPEDSGHSFVDNKLTALDGVKSDLAKLGVHVMDTVGALRAFLAAPDKTDAHWQRIWAASRAVPLDVAVNLYREYLPSPLEHSVCVRVATGAMRAVAEVFLAGEIIPPNSRRDRERLVDPVFHAEDESLLRQIGATDKLVWRHDPPSEPWLEASIERLRTQFVDRIQKTTGTRPAAQKVVAEGPPPPWPIEPLSTMSEEARLEATRQILARPLPDQWTIYHATARNYQRFKVDAPELSFLRRHGLLNTSFGPLQPSQTVLASAHDAADPNILPVYETSEAVAQAIGIRTSVDDLTADTWAALKQVADEWNDDERRAEFYAWLPGRLNPEFLVARVGPRREKVKVKNVGVTSDRSVYASMLEARIPALWVASQADVDEQFISCWGMPDGKDLLQEEIVSESSGEPEYLVDLFPPVKVRLAAQAPEAMDVSVQSCSRLVKMIATPDGQRARSIPYHRDGDTIMVTAVEPRARLQQAAEALSLGLQPGDIAKIFDEMERNAANKRRHAIKNAKDDDDRLLTAVGVDAIRRIVPAQALEELDAAHGSLDDRDVAALARAVHGVGILKQLRGALESAGLEPPKEWSGRRITRQWVSALGFPTDWAGFPSADRPATEIINGPVNLGDLHPYQVAVTRTITALLRGIGPDRGMVSLPTGAGKTRVTVQALVDGVRDGDIATDVPLVWIAQTDELCEQAAETWTEVWRARGLRMPMRLGRLWFDREVDEEPGSFQLIIATIAKVGSIAKRDDASYTWLQTPSVVVIDEAHTSVATSYTSVLEWLGRSTRGRRLEDRRPLIGLTATPFRGNSAYETERLANRYDNNRLDRGAFRNDDDSYGELQSMGVLAAVRHALIDGSEVRLSDDELTRIAEFGGGRLPSEVENRLGERLDRTRRIVDHIASQPDDWTMLVFTPSVENARIVAALLSHRGISAVSVSADTDAAARRYYVEEFKAGRIRVITNYNILAQGFDAPKVRAVYVARPTFSPNVYQQMIGRGLRGPKNGGLDEVLIVNVNDNFVNYGEQLAFTEFEYLWSRR